MKKILLTCLAAMAVNATFAEVETASSEAEFIATIEGVTGWTADELKAGLDRLDALYQNDMKSADGRKRWHGEVRSTVYDENRLVKVYTYEDGFTFEEPFAPVKVRPIEEQISAADRLAKIKARKEAQKRDRITRLEEHFDEEVEALMAAKKWPRELAALYLEHELNELKGPITVDTVITPQNNH